MISQNTEAWHTKYFKLKEMEEVTEARSSLSDLPFSPEAVHKTSHKITERKPSFGLESSENQSKQAFVSIIISNPLAFQSRLCTMLCENHSPQIFGSLFLKSSMQHKSFIQYIFATFFSWSAFCCGDISHRWVKRYNINYKQNKNYPLFSLHLRYHLVVMCYILINHVKIILIII